MKPPIFVYLSDTGMYTVLRLQIRSGTKKTVKRVMFIIKRKNIESFAFLIFFL